MLGYQLSWRASLLLVISISIFVSSKPLPDITRRNETFNHGPYALRLVSTHPNLTNAFFTTGRVFKQNSDSKKIQPIWGGASYWQFLRPNASDNLYENGGAIFLDDRLDNTNSPQLVWQYIKGPDEHVPYLNWNWEAGPGKAHLWPGNWYVSWGGFRFVRQSDSGKVFLFAGDGPDPRWRLAAEYAPTLDSWYMKSWNSTDPSVPLPQNWEFVNVEVIPFEDLGNGNL